MTHDGDGAFVIVLHTQRIALAGFQVTRRSSIVYASASHAAIYTETLPRLHYDTVTRVADFALIRGLPGAYIANQELESRHARQVSDRGRFVTKVTYNGGVTWERISAPDSFTHSECDRCVPGHPCYLNLHGSAVWGRDGSPPTTVVYSHNSAPGVLMGVGMVGSHGNADGDVCTWLSIDGGVTWRDVAVGLHTFEYGDFGGILVMARHRLEGPTDVVKISIDEGHCWHSIAIEPAMLVQNIR